MNWSGDLKCSEPEQVLMLLKSSDCVMHDLTEIFYKCDDKKDIKVDLDMKYYIVLRKWETIEPCSEFRCFVSHNQLIGMKHNIISEYNLKQFPYIGITQRNHSQYFPFLKSYSENIKNSIQKFYQNQLLGEFESHTCVFYFHIFNFHNRKLRFNY